MAIANKGYSIGDFQDSADAQCNTGKIRLQESERLTKDRENHNIPAEFDQGFKTVHNSGINDFKGNLRSWCLIFFAGILRISASQAQGTIDQRRQIYAGDGGNHIRIPADALVHHISGDKDRTDVVADRQKDLRLFFFQLSGLQ